MTEYQNGLLRRIDRLNARRKILDFDAYGEDCRLGATIVGLEVALAETKLIDSLA